MADTLRDAVRRGTLYQNARTLVPTDDAVAVLAEADRWGWTLPTKDHGVTYKPWTDGHAVGFECEWPNGATTWIYLNPSAIGDEGERPNVFLYEGAAGDPGADMPHHYYDLDKP